LLTKKPARNKTALQKRIHGVFSAGGGLPYIMLPTAKRGGSHSIKATDIRT
jgi:hypothetical protein